MDLLSYSPEDPWRGRVLPYPEQVRKDGKWWENYRSELVQEKGAYAIINRTQVLKKVRY